MWPFSGGSDRRGRLQTCFQIEADFFWQGEVCSNKPSFLGKKLVWETGSVDSVFSAAIDCFE